MGLISRIKTWINKEVLTHTDLNAEFDNITDNIVQATTLVKGVVELATDAEVIAGTDTERVITPANVTAKIDTDGTLAGNLDTRIPSQKAVKAYADTMIADAEFTAADEVMVGTGAGTHSQVTLAASQFLAKGATGAIGNKTATEARTILNVEDNANAYVHPNHTGDVTSVADGATTIAANAVTNAKAAQMATKTYKGRTTAATGNAEDVPVATVKADLVLVKADVGLDAVDNTADSAKPVSTAQQTALNTKTHFDDIFSDYVVNGLLPATSANLTSNISAGQAYVIDKRIDNAITSNTYTASKDTYVDVDYNGAYTFSEVVLGAAAPAIAANSIRLAKVITDADNITGVTDLRTLETDATFKLNALAATTSAELAEVISDETGSGKLVFGAADIGARAYNSVAQTISTNTWTALNFDGEVYDTDAIHDTVTNNSRLTCQTAGKYIITGNAAFASNATGDRFFDIRLNGSIILTEACFLAESGQRTAASLSTLYPLAVGDYVEFRVWQSSGVNLDTSLTDLQPNLAMQRIN